MKVIEVTRTISGSNYSNLSAKAVLDERDSVELVSLELDAQLRRALNSIERNIEKKNAELRQNQDTVGMLERALKYAKENEMPF